MQPIRGPGSNKNVSFVDDNLRTIYRLIYNIGTSKNRINNSRIEIDASEKPGVEEEERNKKKIFMTENFLNLESKELFTFHDVIVPGGKNAKLVSSM